VSGHTMLNDRQRWVIYATLGATAAMLLYPPWAVTLDSSAAGHLSAPVHQSSGYSWIWVIDGAAVVRKDFLIYQTLAVVLLGVIALSVVRTRLPQGNKEPRAVRMPKNDEPPNVVLRIERGNATKRAGGNGAN